MYAKQEEIKSSYKNAARTRKMRENGTIVNIKIMYNKYSMDGNFVGQKEYVAKHQSDYDRVMRIMEENPDEYEIVNCEYGF